MSDPAPHMSIPRPALRVGVTGTRHLQTASINRIRTELDAAFACIRAAAAAVVDTPVCRDLYAGAAPSTRLRLLSPLALGADRLAAESALACGYELCVPMPFPLAEYQTDFTGTHSTASADATVSAAEDLAQFRHLLACSAERVELDGSHAHGLEDTSYQAVGRYVAHHSDLLIAVWNGQPEQGPGGTAEVVRIAANASVPVLWIHAEEDRRPVWVEDAQDLRDPDTAAHSGSATECLAAYVRGVLTPPPPEIAAPEGVFTRLSMAFRRPQSALTAYLLDDPAKPRAWYWHAYAALMDLTGVRNTPWQEPSAPGDSIGQYWFGRYSPTDKLANRYAAQYRSTYTWVILFTTLTILFAALAGVVHLPTKYLPVIMALLEVLILGLILVLVVASLRFGWHAKSIEYRLLAELFRKQQLLASLNRSLPFNNVQHFADSEKIDWITWYFAACVRDGPLANAPALNFEESRARVKELLHEQIRYHEQREAGSYRALAKFESASSGIFFFVFVLALVKLVAEFFEREGILLKVLGVLTVALPAFSAAFVTLRSYSELKMLAEQSRHMTLQLQRAQTRVDRLSPHRILAAQDLGREATQIALMMLQDLEGWGRLFRGKPTEAG